MKRTQKLLCMGLFSKKLMGPCSCQIPDHLEYYARVFSEALGRTIRYRDVPLSGWSEKLLGAGVPVHIVKHLSVMTNYQSVCDGAIEQHRRCPAKELLEPKRINRPLSKGVRPAWRIASSSVHSRRCVIPNCRRRASRISGGSERHWLTADLRLAKGGRRRRSRKRQCGPRWPVAAMNGRASSTSS
jgi:hypothetical protein